MNRNIQWIGIGLGVLLLAGIGWWAFGRGGEPVPQDGDPIADIEKNWKQYDNAELGLSFKYPPDYYLEEKTVNAAQRLHKQIILTEDTEENRRVREGNAPGREGPVAITIDVHQNNLDKQSALQWAENTSISNFKLSDGQYATTTLFGEEAVAYTWSGLYQGDTIAVANDRYVYAFTTTYIGPEDRIRQDFVKVLATAAVE